MSRYIDADLIEFPLMESRIDKIWMRVAIDAVPTADVVGVVRCKDCVLGHKHKSEDVYICPVLGACFGRSDFFCAFGTKKEDNNETDC